LLIQQSKSNICIEVKGQGFGKYQQNGKLFCTDQVGKFGLSCMPIIATAFQYALQIIHCSKYM
jgi:hypothetical protein